MFTPARRNFGPREILPVAFSRGRIKARTASRKGAAAHRRFTAKQSEPTPIDACCDRRQACDSICGTSTKFCDAELKSCAGKGLRRRAGQGGVRPQEVDDAAHAVHGPGRLQAPHGRPGRRLQVRQARRGAGAAAEDHKRGLREERRRPVWKSTSVPGATVEGTRRKILISTQAATRRRRRASRPRRTRRRNSALYCTSSWPSTRR